MRLPAKDSILFPSTRELYPFQKEWVEWVVQRGFGCNWDAPGLGKTTQAIVAAASLGGKWLIVCPNSLKQWWKREIINLYPSEAGNVITSTVGGRIIDPTEKLRDFREKAPHIMERKGLLPQWVITHYAGVRISEGSYRQINWTGVILDEAHYIKNHKARRTKAVLAVTPDAAYRIALTATPFGVNPADLWAQLHWIAPTVRGLRSYWRWFNIFVEYSWEDGNYGRYRKIKGGKNLEMLSEVMAAYGKQRSKELVAPQLPPVTHTDMPLDMEDRQATVLEAMKEKDRVELVIANTAESDNPIPGQLPTDQQAPYTALLLKNHLGRLTRMEQWLSAPWKFDPGVKGAKLEWILDWAAEYGYPAVIATRFRSSAQRIAAELWQAGQRCERSLTGGLPEKITTAVLDHWREGKYQFLVGTIGKLGVGLNLQPAHSMICYDQVHSPIQMEQLYQRIHRIDSDHPVEIVYLVIQGTCNELILKSFREKWNQMKLVAEFLKHIQANQANQANQAKEAI